NHNGCQLDHHLSGIGVELALLAESVEQCSANIDFGLSEPPLPHFHPTLKCEEPIEAKLKYAPGRRIGPRTGLTDRIFPQFLGFPISCFGSLRLAMRLVNTAPRVLQVARP